jgi:hypothetical protein
MNLGAWWRAFWDSLTLFKDLPNTVERLKKLAGLLVLLLAAFGGSVKGINAFTEIRWASWVEPWTQYLILLAAVYITWKAAIARVATKGPLIKTGGVELDEAERLFYTSIRNSGPGNPTALMFAVEIRDADENLLGILKSKLQMAWHGNEPLRPYPLFGREQVLVRLVGIQQLGEVGSLLYQPFLYGVKDGQQSLVPIDGPMSVENLREFRLTVRTVFCQGDDPIKDEDRSFAFIPDRNSKLLYRVEPIKRATKKRVLWPLRSFGRVATGQEIQQDSRP